MLKLQSGIAPAKINLFLRVTGRRSDGYHELDSVFLPIALYDRVGIGVRQAMKPATWLRCDNNQMGPDDHNLAIRAATAFMAAFDVCGEIMIDLQKRIPIGAGLGGGSSDAGTVLRILAQVFRIDDSAKLRAVAVGVGADVPFFLEPAPSRVRGIGEQVERLPRFLPFELVLAVPPINVSTAEIFRALRPEQWSGPATHGSIMLLADGRLDPGLLVNDLAAVAMNKYPLINEMRLALNRAGAIGASMTGSGGAVFGIFASAPSADIAAAELGRQYREVDFLRAAVLPKVPV